VRRPYMYRPPSMDGLAMNLLASTHPGTSGVGNLKFHEYKFKKPSKSIQSLLDHIENNGDPTF
jgi:hypothetical protein